MFNFKNITLFITFLCAFNYLSAQNIVEFNSATKKEVLKKYLYQFDTFTEGVIFYKDGKAKGLLNYNQEINEMQFIHPEKNDTQAVANLDNIELFIIDTIKYIPLKDKRKCIRVISNHNKYDVAVYKNVSFEKYGVKTGYSISNSSQSMNQQNSLAARQDEKLLINETYKVKEDIKYYLIDENGVINPLNQKNIKKQLPEEEYIKLENYIKSEKLSWKKELDLVKITTFLNTK